MRVLIGHDGSTASDHALERAIAFFREGSDEFVVLRAFTRPLTTADGADEIAEAARVEAHEELEQVRQTLLRAGVQGRLRLIEGDARDVLDRVVAEECPDVVVLGARGASGLAKLLLGSVSSYAVKHLSCPVLIVRD